MIKQVRLVDWKSFADATLYIDPLTILIGTNASGKSNALDAGLEDVRRLQLEKTITDYLRSLPERDIRKNRQS